MRKEGLTPIPVMFRTYYDTKANLDLLAGLLNGELGFATDEQLLYRQNGDGAANWVSISPPGASSSGTYTGDDSVNRAIPHGLGAIPKIVMITNGTDGNPIFRIFDQAARIMFMSNATSGGYSVTALDITNIYVGNAISQANSGNANTKLYYWVAIG